MRIPLAFCLGAFEAKLRPGAFVRLHYFSNAPNAPPGWLLACIHIRPQTIHPDMTKEEGERLLQVGARAGVSSWSRAVRSLESGGS